MGVALLQKRDGFETQKMAGCENFPEMAAHEHDEKVRGAVEQERG